MNSRRRVLSAAALAALGFLYGCATRRVPTDRYVTHTETVSSVLISADGANIVFIGDWHYIFDAPAGLVKAINGPYHEALAATIGQVDIDLSNQVSMPYGLSLTNATPSQRAVAMADGFRPGASGDELVLGGQLRGKVYRANGVRPPAQSVGLNRAYKVTVRRESRALGYQDVPSPIRAVGEAGLAILTLPLLLLMLPLIAGSVSAGLGPR